jgi:hypothetical protein
MKANAEREELGFRRRLLPGAPHCALAPLRIFRATIPGFFLCNGVEAVRADETSMKEKQLLT